VVKKLVSDMVDRTGDGNGKISLWELLRLRPANSYIVCLVDSIQGGFCEGYASVARSQIHDKA